MSLEERIAVLPSNKYEPINKNGLKIKFTEEGIFIKYNLTYSNTIYASVIISFDDERYERIYKSILKKVEEENLCIVKINEGFNRTLYTTPVIPEQFIIPHIDHSKWSKEDLIKFIEEGNTYSRDNRPFFKSNGITE